MVKSMKKILLLINDLAGYGKVALSYLQIQLWEMTVNYIMV